MRTEERRYVNMGHDVLGLERADLTRAKGDAAIVGLVVKLV